jgi:hypothetical protein
VLTHASFMTAHASAVDTSWIHRGKLVRERLLCETLKGPPNGVEGEDPKDPARLTNPECSGCHLLMDPIGIGFDAYSAIGNYRLTDEQGQSVETAGEVVETSSVPLDDVAGEFDGAVELAHKLAVSESVGRCVAVQWFRYAARRLETDQDACSVAAIQQRFAETGSDIRELMLSIATTHAFRYRALPGK